MAPAIEMWFLNVLPSIPKTYLFRGRNSLLTTYGALPWELFGPSVAVILDKAILCGYRKSPNLGEFRSL
jgi:hypothetical protein